MKRVETSLALVVYPRDPPRSAVHRVRNIKFVVGNVIRSSRWMSFVPCGRARAHPLSAPPTCYALVPSGRLPSTRSAAGGQVSGDDRNKDNSTPMLYCCWPRVYGYVDCRNKRWYYFVHYILRNSALAHLFSFRRVSPPGSGVCTRSPRATRPAAAVIGLRIRSGRLC